MNFRIQTESFLKWSPALTLALFLGFMACGKNLDYEFDLIIANGRVVDGSGSLWFPADVAIRGDEIIQVGKVINQEKRARRIIDATGLTVTPGFVDIQSHSDFSLLVDGTAHSKVHQGITTEVLGEGSSAGPLQGKATLDLRGYKLEADWTTLGEYFDRLNAQGISVNVASYVGAGQVRRCVLGEVVRNPSSAEMEQIKRLVNEAMRDGALGLSSALSVFSDNYLTTSQMRELVEVVKAYGGIYSTQIRDDGQGIQKAFKESIRLVESLQLPTDIIQLKIADRLFWGQMKNVIDLIEKSRKENFVITANQLPYTAIQNDLRALLPPWVRQDGKERMLERLGNVQLRGQMQKELYEGVSGWFNYYLAIGNWEGIVVAGVNSDKNQVLVGRSVNRISIDSNKKPSDVVFDLLLEEGGVVPAIYNMMNEADVRYAMQVPWVSIGSNGTAVKINGILGRGRPHPSWYGTFPRVLGKYVREEQVLSLEEAVQKMTWMNAAKVGLKNRGLLQIGKKADITIFSAERVRDRATFENPHQYAEGIEYVIVNGVLVIDEERHLGTTPGKILFGPGKSVK